MPSTGSGRCRSGLIFPAFASSVVHSCWHDMSREALKPFLDKAGRFTEEGLLESYRPGSVAHSAVEVLLKGPEERLPAGVHFI